ncbi:hypothetical protein BESB_051500 [Besnoitia besnoiti]|uniref:Uncharacterized protein n=1 Tax=Besnoitia besnoiti TaxID=94643 RepID=A0A2A9MCA2_BESBE|nr:hypothetical protein BESB_051500 [Besnoitia besnoiti]PFH35499.1 hypothetical protein BESB_051500 [Besnoitia besnoiti]
MLKSFFAEELLIRGRQVPNTRTRPVVAQHLQHRPLVEARPSLMPPPVRAFGPARDPTDVPPLELPQAAVGVVDRQILGVKRCLHGADSEVDSRSLSKSGPLLQALRSIVSFEKDSDWYFLLMPRPLPSSKDYEDESGYLNTASTSIDSRGFFSEDENHQDRFQGECLTLEEASPGSSHRLSEGGADYVPGDSCSLGLWSLSLVRSGYFSGKFREWFKILRQAVLTIQDVIRYLLPTFAKKGTTPVAELRARFFRRQSVARQILTRPALLSLSASLSASLRLRAASSVGAPPHGCVTVCGTGRPTSGTPSSALTVCARGRCHLPAHLQGAGDRVFSTFSHPACVPPGLQLPPAFLLAAEGTRSSSSAPTKGQLPHPPERAAGTGTPRRLVAPLVFPAKACAEIRPSTPRVACDGRSSAADAGPDAQKTAFLSFLNGLSRPGRFRRGAACLDLVRRSRYTAGASSVRGHAHCAARSSAPSHSPAFVASSARKFGSLAPAYSRALAFRAAARPFASCQRGAASASPFPSARRFSAQAFLRGRVACVVRGLRREPVGSGARGAGSHQRRLAREAESFLYSLAARSAADCEKAQDSVAKAEGGGPRDAGEAGEAGDAGESRGADVQAPPQEPAEGATHAEKGDDGQAEDGGYAWKGHFYVRGPWYRLLKLKLLLVGFFRYRIKFGAQLAPLAAAGLLRARKSQKGTGGRGSDSHDDWFLASSSSALPPSCSVLSSAPSACRRAADDAGTRPLEAEAADWAFPGGIPDNTRRAMFKEQALRESLPWGLLHPHVVREAGKIVCGGSERLRGSEALLLLLVKTCERPLDDPQTERQDGDPPRVASVGAPAPSSSSASLCLRLAALGAAKPLSLSLPAPLAASGGKKDRERRREEAQLLQRLQQVRISARDYSALLPLLNFQFPFEVFEEKTTEEEMKNFCFNLFRKRHMRGERTNRYPLPLFASPADVERSSGSTPGAQALRNELAADSRALHLQCGTCGGLEREETQAERQGCPSVCEPSPAPSTAAEDAEPSEATAAARGVRPLEAAGGDAEAGAAAMREKTDEASASPTDTHADARRKPVREGELKARHRALLGPLPLFKFFVELLLLLRRVPSSASRLEGGSSPSIPAETRSAEDASRSLYGRLAEFLISQELCRQANWQDAWVALLNASVQRFPLTSAAARLAVADTFEWLRGPRRGGEDALLSPLALAPVLTPAASAPPPPRALQGLSLCEFLFRAPSAGDQSAADAPRENKTDSQRGEEGSDAAAKAGERRGGSEGRSSDKKEETAGRGSGAGDGARGASMRGLLTPRVAGRRRGDGQRRQRERREGGRSRRGCAHRRDGSSSGRRRLDLVQLHSRDHLRRRPRRRRKVSSLARIPAELEAGLEAQPRRKVATPLGAEGVEQTRNCASPGQRHLAVAETFAAPGCGSASTAGEGRSLSCSLAGFEVAAKRLLDLQFLASKEL